MSSNEPSRPRTVLICHAESTLNREAVAPWLASFTDLAGIVLIEERGSHTTTRIRKEIKRIGVLRFLDVLAFRAYYAVRLARQDSTWLRNRLADLSKKYPPLKSDVEILRTPNPNAAAVQEFLQRLAPDMVIARCKRILHERIFSVPRFGTYVLHPGICPEYRNAHGAFWALANRDLERVGLTLLRIDRGVDTGPVYGYYSYPFDEVAESHIVIMTRLVLDNLDALRDKLLAIHRNQARPIDTTGRASGVWGQPWLSKYLGWKRAAKRRRSGPAVA